MDRGADGTIAARARDPERGIGLELELRPESELVRHGDRGYSRKGEDEGNASVYLSWTRLQVVGELEVGGAPVTVKGAAWFDHEWGTSQLGAEVAGWDWFSLRLDDGRDLMVYRLRRSDGEADLRSSGTLVEADGTLERLGRDDVGIDVLQRWRSVATGGRYPTRWRLRVPAGGIDLEVRALLTAARARQHRDYRRCLLGGAGGGRRHAQRRGLRRDDGVCGNFGGPFLAQPPNRCSIHPPKTGHRFHRRT